jgi:hypothetical protein
LCVFDICTNFVSVRVPRTVGGRDATSVAPDATAISCCSVGYLCTRKVLAWSLGELTNQMGYNSKKAEIIR